MEKNKLLLITSNINSESFPFPGSTLLWTIYSFLKPCEITEHIRQMPSQVARHICGLKAALLSVGSKIKPFTLALEYSHALAHQTTENEKI